jgi:hypothetical protein
MCLNCVSNVDVAVVGGTAAVGLSRAGVRSALVRLGLMRSRTRAESDLDAADYLTSIGLDSLVVLGVAPRTAARDTTATLDAMATLDATATLDTAAVQPRTERTPENRFVLA